MKILPLLRCIASLFVLSVSPLAIAAETKQSEKEKLRAEKKGEAG